MALTVVTTPVISSGIPFILDDAGSIFVAEDGVVVSDTNIGILADQTRHNLDINGEVYGDRTGIEIATKGGADGASNSRLIISETGKVSGGSTGVELGGSDITVSNTGTISGNTGIQASSGGDMSIYNSGDIIGGFGLGITFSGAGEIVNTGLIMSASSDAISLRGSRTSPEEGAVVKNYGTILGDDIAITSDKGTRLEVLNFGTIQGAVRGNSQDDLVVNAGLIVGDVNLFGGNDTYDGRDGSVVGEVLGGLGDDLYIVNDTATQLVEFDDGGSDTVESEVSFVLGDHFEVLDLIGAEDANGIGNALANEISGNGGRNRLNGKAGDDDLSAANGNDTVIGGSGSDTLTGGDGDDTVRGGDEADTVNGGEANDVVKGGAGDDKVSGGNGDDTIYGGLGKDRLFGNEGADKFVFQNRNESPNDSTADNLKDFEVGTDKIDLSGLNPDLMIIGSSGFSGTRGEVRLTETDDGDTIVRVDLDGDGTGDMKINVRDATGLSDSDFIL